MVDPVKDVDGRVEGLVLCLLEVTERRRAMDRDLRFQRQLRRLASELVLAEERERRRIAVALHDNIAQSLALAKMKLAGVGRSVAGDGVGDAGELADLVGSVQGMIDESISYTRSLLFDLSPPILYEVGLEAAVEMLAENTERQHRVTTVFTDDGQPKPVSEDFRVVLFQAVRELLLNVVKHARARTAAVSMRRGDGEILITVADDGVGFDLGRLDDHGHGDGGFGLFSIRERLDHLGGRLDLKSQPGAGTVATLAGPLVTTARRERGV